MKSCLIIVVIIDHLELGLEPEPAHVVIKNPKCRYPDGSKN